MPIAAERIAPYSLRKAILSTEHFNPHKMRHRSRSYERHNRTQHAISGVRENQKKLTKEGDLTLTKARETISQVRERISARKKGNLEHEDIILALGAFAASADKTIGLSPYNAQIRASLAQIEGGLHGEKAIIEMNTGEGKTLVGAMTASTLALEGKPVHLATSNDVLALRDMLEMGPVYHALGLTVGVVLSAEGSNEIQYMYDPDSPNGLKQVSRPEAYKADIVYAKASELGFDYERDNKELFARNLRQRGLGYCIVDEIDDVLDQSQTPLIVQGATGDTFSLAIHTVDKEGKRVMHTSLSPAEVSTEEQQNGVLKTEVYSEQRLHRIFAAVFDHMREGIDYVVDPSETEVHFVNPQDPEFKRPTEDSDASDVFGIDRLERMLRGQKLPGDTRPVLNAPLLATNEFLYGPPPNVEDRSEEGRILKAVRDEVGIRHMDAEAIAKRTIKSSRLLHYATSALEARTIFKNRYVVTEVTNPETGNAKINKETKKPEYEIILVDENTKRPIPGTRMMHGVSSAIEALERRKHPEWHIEIHPDLNPASTITYPEYFSMYHRVTGMTATAIIPESRVNIGLELCRTFNVDDIIHISSEFPEGKRDDDKQVRVFETWKDKHAFIAYYVTEMHKKPQNIHERNVVQPILIGAESGTEAELIAQAIRQSLEQAIAAGEIAAFDFNKLQVLHAENTLDELPVIANAGKNGMITITSMFGRGTDIPLGGDKKASRDESYPWETEREDVVAAGGLHLIASEDDPRRMRQFLGRGGRQQDPRSSIRVSSLEDNALKANLTENDFKLIRERLLPQVSAAWDNFEQENGQQLPHPRFIFGPAAAELITRIIGNGTAEAAESRQYVNSLHTVDNAQRLAWFGDRTTLLTGEGLEEQIFTLVKKHRTEFPGLNLGTSPFSIRRILGHEDQELRQRIQKGLTGLGEIGRAVLLHQIDAEWEAYLTVAEEIRQGIHWQVKQSSNRSNQGNQLVVEEFAVATSRYYSQMQQRVRDLLVRSILGLPQTS